MIITIAGFPGSGKSTIARMLASELNYKKYSVGNYRRQMAISLGLTLAELNKLGESQDFTDRQADEWQKQLGEREDDFVIEGRNCFYFIPHSLKVYLDVLPEIGAKRIMLANRQEEKMYDDKHALELVTQRVESDIKRYKQYYNLNPYDKTQYDLVVDTSFLEPEEVMTQIISRSRGES